MINVFAVQLQSKQDPTQLQLLLSIGSSDYSRDQALSLLTLILQMTL